MRFRSKTILGVALIEMVLLAVLVGSTLSILRASNEEALAIRVKLGARLLAAAAKDAVISQDLATLDSLVAEAIASGQIAFVRFLDGSGAILAQRGDPELLSRQFHRDILIDQMDDDTFQWSASVEAGGIRYGEVQIGVSTAPLQVLLSSARRWAAGIAGLEMVLVALFSWLLGSFLVRQLGALRRASDLFATGDFAQRVAVKGDDELAETAVAFNRMAQQLGDHHELLQNENQQRLQAQLEAERAQASAKDRSDQLNEIFAISPDGLVSFDAALRVKFVSPAFARLTGVAESEVTGLGEAAFSQRLAQECAANACFVGVETLRQGAGEHRQKIELASAGKRILEVALHESKAETVSQILYFRDITHETEVDQMKSDFLSTAAHELRTPMASIYGFTELMLAQEFDPQERHDFLATIYRQSELMISIINELLDLSRIEARRGKDFELVRLDVRELLRGIVTGFKVPDDHPVPVLPTALEPVWVNADRKKLIQAVGNVLSNAYKYSPEGGEICLDVVQPANGGAFASPGAMPQVGIRVADHGIGMTPEQRARVFERFYRADTSGKIPGSGLGMSIVQEIVRLHGGEVSVDSTLGSGTRVTIWLPCAG